MGLHYQKNPKEDLMGAGMAEFVGSNSISKSINNIPRSIGLLLCSHPSASQAGSGQAVVSGSSRLTAVVQQATSGKREDLLPSNSSPSLPVLTP